MNIKGTSLSSLSSEFVVAELQLYGSFSMFIFIFHIVSHGSLCTKYISPEPLELG